MKTLSLILTLSFFTLSADLFAIGPITIPDSVEVADSKRIDVMVLKFNKDQVGGQVLVTYSDGEEISKVKIKKKKMIIDFNKLKFGAYKVAIVKEGKEVAVFNYNKELVLSEVVR
ncbi:MAG: hypothetical protein RH948_06045 [Cyclobacteriaceae bacterium]